MNFKSELKALIAAQAPLIHLVTYEEERVVRHILEIDGTQDMGVVSWDVADGFKIHRDGVEPFPLRECTTDTILHHIADKTPRGYIIILKDFHHCWTNRRAYITRKLRNLVPKLRINCQFVIFLTPPLSPENDLPKELKDDVIVLEVPLPDQDELARLFDEATARIEAAKLPKRELKEKLIQSALGLTTTQARLAFCRVWTNYECFDERAIDLITWSKKQIIRESGALEFWSAQENESDVGGLDLLKGWLKKRESAFTLEARLAGLPYPRGVALIGIPGTGKSLSAKMLAGLWKLPLLRLDVGSLFGSLLGESEQNMRKAIMLAETVSPCILWIDELEKAFAGVSAGGLNSGAPSRIFGTFLTWMQEHQSAVFVIATANDVAAIPIELMSRFDRVFFLDLPNDTERREIFKIHLKNAGIAFPDRQFNLDELVEKSRGMVGREIERAVREAQFTAFAEGNREIEQADLLSALEETVPISKSHQEAIELLRRWKTEGRAFPASSEDK